MLSNVILGIPTEIRTGWKIVLSALELLLELKHSPFLPLV